MNGDGFNDVVIGALHANLQFAGPVYVIYGSQNRSGAVSVDVDCGVHYSRNGVVVVWMFSQWSR